MGDYNLSPGEHGGSQYILSPGHESEEEGEEEEEEEEKIVSEGQGLFSGVEGGRG